MFWVLNLVAESVLRRNLVRMNQTCKLPMIVKLVTAHTFEIGKMAMSGNVITGLLPVISIGHFSTDLISSKCFLYCYLCAYFYSLAWLILARQDTSQTFQGFLNGIILESAVKNGYIVCSEER